MWAVGAQAPVTPQHMPASEEDDLAVSHHDTSNTHALHACTCILHFSYQDGGLLALGARVAAGHDLGVRQVQFRAWLS